MRLLSRYLHVVLAAALILHDGSLGMGNAMAENDAPSMQLTAPAAVQEHETEAVEEERDCHGQMHNPGSVSNSDEHACEHDTCASCVCALAQNAAMAVRPLLTPPSLSNELRSPRIACVPLRQPTPLLRPPIA